ncbi:hypothetical protein ACO0QE_004511 [Hanseniaspora vineae]
MTLLSHSKRKSTTSLSDASDSAGFTSNTDSQITSNTDSQIPGSSTAQIANNTNNQIASSTSAEAQTTEPSQNINQNPTENRNTSNINDINTQPLGSRNNNTSSNSNHSSPLSRSAQEPKNKQHSPIEQEDKPLLSVPLIQSTKGSLNTDMMNQSCSNIQLPNTTPSSKRRLEQEHQEDGVDGNNANKTPKLSEPVPLSPNSSESADSRHNSFSNVPGSRSAVLSTNFTHTKRNINSISMTPPSLPQYSFTRYCYRHNPEYHTQQQDIIRQRRLSLNSNIQQDSPKNVIRNLIKDDALFEKFQKEVSNDEENTEILKFLNIFSGSIPQKRELLLKMILNLCCSPQLSFISSEVNSLIKIDFISTLPQEISMKILSYLDCSSLCNASIVSKTWKAMADDDRIWYHLCEQHIDRKCPQCGWGLPLLQMKRRRVISNNVCVNGSNEVSVCDTLNTTPAHTPHPPLPIVQSQTAPQGPLSAANSSNNNSNNNNNNNNTVSTALLPRQTPSKPGKPQGCVPGRTKTRPWKVVYKERFYVEKNWRKGIYKKQEFVGHLDGVLDCKLSFNLNFNLLFTGSYDCTIGIWDINTGNLLRRLSGHSQGVKTLHFDGAKLITGSLDKTIRVWNYNTGQCVSTYRGHTDSVLSIDAYKKIIVSGSADNTIKVWHVESRTCFTLRGHTEWVSCVKLHPSSFTCFSCSDDMTIKMWDIRENKLLKTFQGHVGQVQKVIPLTIIDEENLISDIDYDRDYKDPELDTTLKYPTHLLSCSLDNTIKLWHVQSGTCLRTHFGHVEGVWDIAADNFRIVSGSHDKTVKVWDLQSGKLIHSFANMHDAPITCVDIGDSEFVSGDETGKVCMVHFDV